MTNTLQVTQKGAEKDSGRRSNGSSSSSVVSEGFLSFSPIFHSELQQTLADVILL
jgi:hypothetical protein